MLQQCQGDGQLQVLPGRDMLLVQFEDQLFRCCSHNLSLVDVIPEEFTTCNLFVAFKVDLEHRCATLSVCILSSISLFSCTYMYVQVLVDIYYTLKHAAHSIAYTCILLARCVQVCHKGHRRQPYFTCTISLMELSKACSSTKLSVIGQQTNFDLLCGYFVPLLSFFLP